MNPWLQLGASLFIGVMTAGGALLGVRMNAHVGERGTVQRELQARREEWSKRFFEALSYVADESPRKREIGLGLMEALAQSELAGPDERRLMEISAQRVLNPLLKQLAEVGGLAPESGLKSVEHEEGTS